MDVDIDYKNYLDKLDKMQLYQLKLIYYLYNQIKILCYNVIIELENIEKYIQEYSYAINIIRIHRKYEFFNYLITHSPIRTQIIKKEKEEISNFQEIINENNLKKPTLIMTQTTYYNIIAIKHILTRLFEFENELYSYKMTLNNKLHYIISGMENFKKTFYFCIKTSE